ncbi:MAG: hypothetical protein KDB83_04225 [Actinobacteria bacterium]|nr:hypothetical protein [Actinomycetota bacterium]MCB0920903.1 hypothetical protein [Actinomycetota bacterium]
MAKRENVTSREYKVMLRARLFDGDEQRMHSAIDAFWTDLTAALAAMDIPCEGSFTQVKARRLIRFFDTDEHRINADQYIVREREDLDTGEREVTLKFRHPDRYVAADRRMDPADARDAKTKFEEDVKPPFVSVYSFSTTQPLQSGSVLGQVQDVADLFPGLADDLSELPTDAPLLLVRDFVGREIVLEGASLLLGKRDILSECALVVWYDEGETDTTPVVVEFSFKYGDDAEDYRGSVARDAYAVLGMLQNQMTDWVDPNPVTKTAFVYG